MRRRRLAAVLAAATMAGGLAACTQADDVATLGGESASAPGVDAIAAQARGAEEFAACLEGLGVPTEGDDPYGDGQRSVWLSTDDDYLAAWGDGSSSMGGDPPLWMKEMAAKYDPYVAEELGGAPAEPEAPEGGESPPPVVVEPYLVMGKDDLTADFRKCIADSGYTEPVYYYYPEKEIAEKEAILEPTMEWIACARENGYPNIKDPFPAQADEWATNPTAVLPADMAEDQLRTLLEDCPVFDEEAETAYRQALADLGPDRTSEQIRELAEKFTDPQPAIGFDVPGQDGDYRPGRETDAPLDPHVRALLDVLVGEFRAFEEAHPDWYRS